MSADFLETLLRQDEGERLHPYKDTRGFLTIGVGRCLDTEGISAEESAYLLQNDKARFRKGVSDKLPWALALDALRFDVLCAIAFQLGVSGLLEFEDGLAALQKADWQAAHDAFLDSAWARQTPGRARKYATLLLTGNMP